MEAELFLAREDFGWVPNRIVELIRFSRVANFQSILSPALWIRTPSNS